MFADDRSLDKIDSYIVFIMVKHYCFRNYLVLNESKHHQLIYRVNPNQHQDLPEIKRVTRNKLSYYLNTRQKPLMGIPCKLALIIILWDKSIINTEKSDKNAERTSPMEQRSSRTSG